MNELTHFWLQMLLLIVVFGAMGRLREGWRWNAGGLLQQLLMAGIALYGLQIANAQTCMWLGWGLLILINAWPPVLLKRLQRHISLLDATSAQEEATRARLFLWGPPGRFWSDIARSLALALEGNVLEPRAMMMAYMTPPTPMQYRLLAGANLQGLREIERDWEGLIGDFELRVPDDGSALPPGLTDAVFRAYLEVGEIESAVRLLERASRGSGRRQPREMHLLAVSFYALAGARADLEFELAELDLPPFAADAWRARCLAAKGQVDEAVILMATAIAAVPEDQQAFAQRLQAQLPGLADLPHPGIRSENLAHVGVGRRLLTKMQHTAAILEPARGSWAVSALVIAIGLAFLPAHAYELFPADRTLALSDWIQSHGQLSATALGAEPWRLITYQFLHADIFHVGLNLVVLWMFGRQVEALFGPWAVLAIFFVTGALGGAGQLALAPDSQAIGASGAVLGVFGAVIGGLARSKDTLPVEIRKDRVGRLVSIAAIQMVLDQVFAGHIAVYVHAAGLFSGALLGFLAPLSKVKHDP
jgi:membrane associated rhomboid family serine protease